jgi:hypothetical protein
MKILKTLKNNIVSIFRKLEVPTQEELPKVEMDFPVSITGVHNKTNKKVKALSDEQIKYLTSDEQKASD